MSFESLSDPGDGSAPRPVGSKFSAARRPIRFAGNTIVAHVSHTSPVFAAIVAIQDSLRGAGFGPKFAFLPPSSLHMTVFEGVNDPERDPERWPKDMALDTPLSEVTDAFAERLEGISAPLPFRLRPAALTCSPGAGSYLRLEGADAEMEAGMRALRDRFSATLNHAKPQHESYVWHITLSYQIAWLTGQEAEGIERLSDTLFGEFAAAFPEVVLDRCEFCRFDDMEWFEPVKRL